MRTWCTKALELVAFPTASVNCVQHPERVDRNTATEDGSRWAPFAFHWRTWRVGLHAHLGAQALGVARASRGLNLVVDAVPHRLHLFLNPNGSAASIVVPLQHVALASLGLQTASP